jgi:hypothetical protein
MFKALFELNREGQIGSWRVLHNKNIRKFVLHQKLLRRSNKGARDRRGI